MMLKFELLDAQGQSGNQVFISVLAVQSVEETTHKTERGLNMAAATIRMFGGKEFTVLDLGREVGPALREAEEEARKGKDRRAVVDARLAGSRA